MSGEQPQNPLDNSFLSLKPLQGKIWLMTMRVKAFSLSFIEAINRALDYLDAQTGEIGLITASAHPTIYSAGIDFEQFSHGITYTESFLIHFQKMLARFLALSYPTVAAINGHCYAGGLMFAMVHDFRVQRKDMGNTCLSEINMGMPLPKGMMQFMESKLSYTTSMKLMLFGANFTPKDNLESNVVDKLVDTGSILEEAAKLIEPLVEKSSARESFATIKQHLNRKGIDAALQLHTPPLHLLPGGNRQKL